MRRTQKDSTWEERFDKEFANPDTTSSIGQFNPKYQGKLYGALKEWFSSELERQREEIIDMIEAIRRPPYDDIKYEMGFEDALMVIADKLRDKKV